MDRYDDDAVPGEGEARLEATASMNRRRRRSYRARSTALGIVVASVWMGLALDPGVGPAIGGVVAAVALTVGILAVAVGLGWFGGRVFDACGRFWSRLVAAAGWSDDDPALPRDPFQ